uniref:Uncharacterized protein n=1 Tax=Megaselia scalaris TaxID=36166 RepID=T1GP61_MEGSC
MYSVSRMCCSEGSFCYDVAAASAAIESYLEELPALFGLRMIIFYGLLYKTPEEAAHAQNEIQRQYDVLGGQSQVTNEGNAPVTDVSGALTPASSNRQSNFYNTVKTIKTIIAYGINEALVDIIKQRG